MEVNALKIKELRTNKGWTQQHLADACSISLRTVQRVERYGNASNETVMGLCAVFEISRSEVLVPETPIEEVIAVVDVGKMFNIKSHLMAMAIGIGLGALVTYVLLKLSI